MDALTVKNLSSGYEGRTVLDSVDFYAKKGEITVLLGPNGSGKSTLLKSISGIITPQKGTVDLNGEDLLSLPPERRARKISYLAQNRGRADISVYSLVLHGRFPYLSYPRRYRDEDKRKVDEVLEKLGLSEKKDRMIGELSGGERQKAYIAMCLVQETEVVLFDEPTTSLDILHSFSFLDEARFLAERGKAVVMVLHDIPQALGAADIVAVMDGGKVALEGDVESIYESGVLDKTFGVEVKRGEDHWYLKRRTGI